MKISKKWYHKFQYAFAAQDGVMIEKYADIKQQQKFD
jgi:hypothetical protein